MIIRWLGQACFSVRPSDGSVIRMDPFDASLGLPVSKERADVVTVSHAHFDHNAVRLVPGNPRVVDKPGRHDLTRFVILGVAASHDDAGGSKRGKNVIFRFEADGVALCHLGDLGHVLSPEQVTALGRVDVLLVPVGGFYTIDARQADQVIAQLNPRIVVPMHYKLRGMDIPIADEKPFLANKTHVRRLDQLDVTAKTLPEKPEVVVLRGPS